MDSELIGISDCLVACVPLDNSCEPGKPEFFGECSKLVNCPKDEYMEGITLSKLSLLSAG